MNTFYMVVLDGGSTPTKRYEDPAAAHREAERLAFKEQRAAYVLKAQGRVTPAPPAMNWESLQDAPAAEPQS